MLHRTEKLARACNRILTDLIPNHLQETPRMEYKGSEHSNVIPNNLLILSGMGFKARFLNASGVSWHESTNKLLEPIS